MIFRRKRVRYPGGYERSMNATQILLMMAELLGGLAFFLYGMSAMSSGLEQMAGGALERTLKKVTKNDFLGFFLGAGITVAIQSSSAMTVMLVGLVNSGIMNFADTFGMIMGSNVGTTITAWILTLGGISGDNFLLVLLKPMTFAPLLAFVGIAMRMLSKSEKKHHIGVIMIGFAVLMAGMDMMGNSMETFQKDPAFQSLLTAFSSPLIAFVVSTVFTGVIQSSAATVAIVQAIATTAFLTNDPLTYQVAIPLVLGANIGTCITSLISAIGTNKNAKRVVAVHMSVNAIGGSLCIAIMYMLMAFAPKFMAQPINTFGVAAVHSLFNIGITVLFWPLKKYLLALCEKMVRSDKEEKHTVFLDERIFNNVPLAISECDRLTDEMAEYAREALLCSISLVDEYDEEKANRVRELETLTDKYEDKLGTYLVRLSGNILSDTDSHHVSLMLRSIGDLERFGDHALNICEAAREIKEKKIVFSDSAKKELAVITKALTQILNSTVDSFVNGDIKLASQVEPLEQVIDKLNNELKARHVKRLQKGDCTIQLGFVFNDLLANYERVSDHCSNIAAYTLQINSPLLNTHKYLRTIREEEHGEYVQRLEEFEQLYVLD